MRRWLKMIAGWVASLLVVPCVLAYRLGCLVLGTERAFPGWSQALSLIPGLWGIYLRRAFYRSVLEKCEADACVCFGTIFSHPSAQVGRTVYVGSFCCLGDVTLEDDVLIGSNVSIINGGRQHGTDRLDIPVREQAGEWPRITIGEDTWIGDRAVVMANVGKHCVIGAGSVVMRPIPDYTIAVGFPAQWVRNRDQREAASDVFRVFAPEHS
jgi:virginiamycin A acetyltransferase